MTDPQKPIAFRFADFDGGWVTTESKEEADKAREQGVYVRAFYPRDPGEVGPIMHYAGIPVTSKEYFPDQGKETDLVNHPPHYKAHPSGVECITITEHMNFCLGNAVKYIWRAGEKGNQLEDLKKARWYLDREIQRLTSGSKST